MTTPSGIEALADNTYSADIFGDVTANDIAAVSEALRARGKTLDSLSARMFRRAFRILAEQLRQEHAGEHEVAAADLTFRHIGMEAYLPGRWESDGDGDYRLVQTWAPIVMITHTRKGVVKVRRHPDGQTDHDLTPDELVLIRPPHTAKI